MGIMDGMKDKTNNMDMDSLKARFAELKRKEDNQEINDAEREEMTNIQSKIGM